MNATNEANDNIVYNGFSIFAGLLVFTRHRVGVMPVFGLKLLVFSLFVIVSLLSTMYLTEVWLLFEGWEFVHSLWRLFSILFGIFWRFWSFILFCIRFNWFSIEFWPSTSESNLRLTSKNPVLTSAQKPSIDSAIVLRLMSSTSESVFSEVFSALPSSDGFCFVKVSKLPELKPQQKQQIPIKTPQKMIIAINRREASSKTISKPNNRYYLKI